MFQININNPVHLHFIGIGGISMSGLAAYLNSRGFTISGSDRDTSPITEHLSGLGIKVFRGQFADNISDDIDAVVYTAAIHPDNPEYAECVKRGIPMMDRATLLGQLCRFFKTSIGVAGTHGKTTTTSMLAMILLDADTDPTISVGGILPAIGGNLKIGNGSQFLFEACEYTNSFLKFLPTDEIILNIEADHLDFFKDLDDIRSSFKKYVDLVPENGHIVINGEIENYKEICAGSAAPVVTYGLCHNNMSYENAPYNYTAANISFDSSDKAEYDLVENGRIITHIVLSVPGAHNVSNSLAAIALAIQNGISLEHIKNGLAAYTGTERRFQKKGEFCGITVIDDYAHHPTEIKATIATAESCSANNRWYIFQPHTFSRTIALKDEFIDALSGCSKVILAKIYPARETDTGEISSEDLCSELKSRGVDAYYFSTFDEIEKFLLENLVHGDMLITMGAGDVVKIGEHLLSE